MQRIYPSARLFGRRIGYTYVAIVVAAAVGCWSPGIGFILFLLGIVAVPVVLLIVGGAFALGLWSTLRDERVSTRFTWSFMLAPLATLIAFALLIPTLRAGTWLGDEVLLCAYWRSYSSIIVRVQRSGPPPAGTGAWQRDGSVTYVVDNGTPRRIAFEPSGMLDNWSGIVWDPTHDVLKADGFDPETGRFRAPDRITKLFGGDLVSCRRLGGDWFDCSFT